MDKIERMLWNGWNTFWQAAIAIFVAQWLASETGIMEWTWAEMKGVVVAAFAGGIASLKQAVADSEWWQNLKSKKA